MRKERGDFGTVSDGKHGACRYILRVRVWMFEMNGRVNVRFAFCRVVFFMRQAWYVRLILMCCFVCSLHVSSGLLYAFVLCACLIPLISLILIRIFHFFCARFAFGISSFHSHFFCSRRRIIHSKLFMRVVLTQENLRWRVRTAPPSRLRFWDETGVSLISFVIRSHSPATC